MEAMDLRKLKAALDNELERVRTTRTALDGEPETTDIYVNVGGGAVITCRNIPLDQARATTAQFARWIEGAPDGVLSLDVVSADGTRTVIPFVQVVMMRARTEI